MTEITQTPRFEHPVPALGRVMAPGELQKIFKSPDDGAQLRADLKEIQDSETRASIAGRNHCLGSLATSRLVS